VSIRVLAAPFVLLGALLVVVPAPAQAGGTTVTVADTAFTPAQVTVALGQTVTWSFPQQVNHTTTSDQGFWNSGSRNGGETFARAFASAGTYAYHCIPHPQMTGKVRVPLEASGSAADGWTLRWATGAAPDGRDYDVQVRRNGADTWTWFRRNAEKATGTFDPARSGTWKVRARTSNTDAGKSSQWSPVRSVAVS